MHAGLIFDGIVGFSGQGNGVTNPILSIAGTPSERGCIGTDGTPTIGEAFVGAGACDVALRGAATAHAETSASGLQTLASVGALRATQLRIVFNPAEPSGGSIQLEDLVLKLYDSTGGLIFSSTLAVIPQFAATTDAGAGGSGFLFRLDYDEAQFLESLGVFATLAARQSTFIAIEANVTLSAGAAEAFYVVTTDNLGIPETPEPATLSMFAAAAAGALFYGLRRRR